MCGPLESYRFPKRHDFVVEECRVIDIREIVCWLMDGQRRTLNTVTLGCGLVLVANRCGAARRWYFLCPACRRPCEHLYLLPGESGEAHAVAEQPEPDRTTLSAEELAWAEQEGGWFAVVARAMLRKQAQSIATERAVSLPYPPVGDRRCRICANLNYASQHYGRAHKLRRQLPPRRALSRRRLRQRAEHERKKLVAKCQRETQRVPSLSPEEAERAVADGIALAEKLGMRRMPR